MIKFLFYLFIIIIILILFFSLFKIKLHLFSYVIRFDTFFKKGLPRLDDRFGVWFFCGRQGSGKNFACTLWLNEQSRSLCNKVYTNIHTLKCPGFEFEYFNKLTDIYYNTDEHCIFIVDEISRKFDKTSRTDTQFYAWLNQSRKKKRIVMLITQEWKELPMWIRRPAKYMFQTKQNGFLKLFGLTMTCVGDAENLVFDKDEGEYNCPIIKKVIYKRTKNIADMYDTFEAINEL